MKFLLINSNIESSFAASYIDGEIDVKYSSEFLDNSDKAYLKSPDKLIHCLSYIKDTIEAKGTHLNDIDAISIITGPGSFTGIRVSLALAKGVADTLNKKIIPIDNFELMYKRSEDLISSGSYCLLIPAKRPEFYYKLFENYKEKETGCITIEEFNAKFDKFTVLAGDFSHDYQEKLGYFNVPDKKYLKSGLDSMVAITIEKYNKGEVFEPGKIMPLYMKDFEVKNL